MEVKTKTLTCQKCQHTWHRHRSPEHKETVTVKSKRGPVLTGPVPTIIT